MLRNYFLTAFRNLSRNKVYSLINVTGLSFGMVCVMLILLYVKDETSYDRFQKNGNQVFRVVRRILAPDGSRNNFGRIPFHKSRICEPGEIVEVRMKATTWWMRFICRSIF